MVDLRNLPSVDALVTELSDARGHLPRGLVVEVARAAIDEARSALVAGDEADPMSAAVEQLASLRRLRLQEVVNATGVLLHTNLGRAPLHPEAVQAAASAGSSYGTIEFDLERGRRGSRGAYLNTLFTDLTGAEAALVVNNNAAALFLALHTLAGDRAVPVSRGELIEIGGSYRLPELMTASGARLVEVGTTNRTRVADYRTAIDDDTAMLLKVHPSNYRVMGFSEDAPIDGLVVLAAEHGIPLVHDIGSGLLDAAVPWMGGAPPRWLEGEPAVKDMVSQGVDLVTFSGDKLLGGPQAGIVVGHAELVARLRASPVARALRIDGPTMAALTRTAELYADGRAAEIPFWRMIATPEEALVARLEAIADLAGIPAEIAESEAVAGAGSVPGMTVPSPVLLVRGAGETAWPALLRTDPVVVARRDAGDLILDVRAVEPADDPRLAEALRSACLS